MEAVIFGAGGHGRVILDILNQTPGTAVIGFLDSNPELRGSTVEGLPVLGGMEQVAALFQTHPGFGAVVAIGDNAARAEMADRLRALGVPLLVARHPQATVGPTVKVGSNVVICAGAVVCTNVTLSDDVIINTGAIVDHECAIGRAAHVAPGVRLAGRVTVREGAFVGIGSTVIQNLVVNRWATVGAGAVVIRDVPEAVTVVGVPANAIQKG